MLEAVVFRTLTRSLPYDIAANVSHFNLTPNRIVIAPEETTPTAEATPESPAETTNSTLEALYYATDGTNSFNKVVDFLGTVAEAESLKGKKTFNENSSASGDFHFLVGNGGGYNKEGQKEHLGQYDAKGNLRTSSFETAKKRLRHMMDSGRWTANIDSQPGLRDDLKDILKAKVPTELTAQEQAILAYAHLKMASGDFSQYLQGKMDASDVYGKIWVTNGGSHTTNDIKINWANAIKRGVGKSHYEYLGIAPHTPASSETASADADTNTQVYRNGGSLVQRIHNKKTLI
jgi:hypothetical protein